MNDTARAHTYGPMESKGNIICKFDDVDVNIPIMMQNLDDPLPKVITLALHYTSLCAIVLHF